MDLTPHRVFITGGTQGIGLALATQLVPRCEAVAICGRNPERLADAARKLPAVVPFEVDLGDLDGLPAFVDRLRSRFGRPTILVNNAGVQFTDPWPGLDAAERVSRLRDEVGVNFLSPAALVALFLDDLIRAPAAAIVNVSSILALAPKRSAPVYCATKAGIRSFTKALRYQLDAAPHVRVIEVIPPLVDTAMTAGRGTGKISPDQAAREIVAGLEAGADEILVGKARTVSRLNRWLPGTVARILRTA
ncbi:MAG: SDR family NAD(P)-dependent oxidoreductase [Gemmatimonadales bacterium]